MTQDGQEQSQQHTRSLNATLSHNIIFKCYWVMIVKQLKCVQRCAITCLFFPIQNYQFLLRIVPENL